MSENHRKATSEALAAILAELSTDQIRFVIARQEYSTDKAAAKAVDIKPNTIKRWKMDGTPIDEAVRLMVFDGLAVALELRRRHLAKAMAVKVAGLDDDDGRLRQGVSTIFHRLSNVSLCD